MFDVGFMELVLVSVIGLLVLGPQRLPKVAAELGKWIGRARRTATQLRRQLEREIELSELEPPPKERPPATPPTEPPPPPAEPPTERAAPAADAPAASTEPAPLEPEPTIAPPADAAVEQEGSERQSVAEGWGSRDRVDSDKSQRR